MIFFLKKFLDFLTTLLLVSAVTFLTFQLLPGNPALAILGPEAESSQIEQLEKELHLDQSIVMRYGSWLKGAVTGNLGTSYKYQKGVSFLISESFTVTAKLASLTLLFTVVIGIAFGVVAAKGYRKKYSEFMDAAGSVWISMPVFCTALILIIVFSVLLNILPSMGNNGFKSYILPALSLALGSGAILARYISTSIKNELKKDYVRTARSKGLSEKEIIFHHVFRNAMIPSVTILGIIAAEIFGGSILVENVFSLPGLGRLLTTSISTRDFPLLQGITLYLSFITLLSNFIVDVLYSVIDPRIRISGVES